MRTSVCNLSIVAVAVGAVLAAFQPGWAQSSADAKCHSTIARQVTRYQAVLMKAFTGCHNARSGGSVSLVTDCNAVATADLKDRVPNALVKVANSIAKSCEGASPAVLALYPRCPSPVATDDDGGATAGIDDFAELASCLTVLSDVYAERIVAEILGNPTAVLSSSHQRCQGSIGKAATRVVAAAARARAACQKDQEKALGGLAYDACAGAAGDGDGRIAAALEKLDGRIASDCDFEDGHAIGACGFDASSLRDCVHDRVVEPLANGLVAAAEQLPGTCPSFASFVVNAGSGPKRAATRVDLGYNGYGHDMDVVDGLRGAVALSGCDENCENCQVSLRTTDGSCRCDNDATVECSTIAGPDAACGGGACRCTLGVPLPQNFAGFPMCMMDSFVADLDGSTGAVGEYEVDVQIDSRPHSGIAQAQPCPVCEGDATADDGIRDGLCDGGARSGLPCDGNGVHSAFGVMSLDCRPSPGAAIAAPLTRRLTFTSGTQSLTAAITSPAHCASGTCHCSMCSGDPTIGCSTDSECDALGAGTCGAVVSVNPRQNDCTGGPSNCVDDGSGNGSCSAGPVERYCDGLTEGDGRGILACSVDEDCDYWDCDRDGVITPGECGACSIERDRPCFLPTVSASGKAGPFRGEGVAVFCAPRYEPGGGFFDFKNSAGYPGPGRIRLDLDLDPYCADGSTRFELPGGSNCP